MSSVLQTFAVAALPESEWLDRAARHESRIRAWTDPHQSRQAAGRTHPVIDFLFTYYAFRPAWLRQWHPGPDVILEGDRASAMLRWPEYARSDRGVALDRSHLASPRLREFIPWLRGFLATTGARPPFFGCAGAHEWAMVYRQHPAAVRHTGYPLRFPADQLAAIVESLPICCTHFDAFRFFTPAARPLNRIRPERATAIAHDQPGCLHANMDLYKWAFKLSPFIPSELLADCFELAAAIRLVDMRASPYDLGSLGYAPIKVETTAGRAEYESHQRRFTNEAAPLRARLIGLCTRLLA